MLYNGFAIAFIFIDAAAHAAGVPADLHLDFGQPMVHVPLLLGQFLVQKFILLLHVLQLLLQSTYFGFQHYYFVQFADVGIWATEN